LLICLSFAAGNGCGQNPGRAPAATGTETADSLRKQGGQAFSRGDYAGAAIAWREVASRAGASGNGGGKIDALVNVGSCYEMLGQYDMAKSVFLDAADEAEQARDNRRTALALSNLAVAYTLKPHNPPGGIAEGGHHHGGVEEKKRGLAASHEPEGLFEAALVLLGREKSRDASLKRLEAGIHDNLGNYDADTGKFEAADAEFRASIQLAEELKNDPQRMKARANAANASVAAWHDYDRRAHIAEAAHDKKTRDTAPGFHDRAAAALERAQIDNAAALDCAGHVAPTATKAMLLIQLGRNFEQFAADHPEHLDEAEACYRLAKSAAESSGDLLSRSYAYGYLGHIEELHGEYGKALVLNGDAMFAAQKAGSPDSLYRWQWQQGRIRRAMGKRDDALLAYLQAVETVKAIRNDIALANGNVRGRFNFRDDVAALYFELSDLLFAQGFELKEQDPRRARKLTLARDTLESLKSAELEDYLRDDCVQLYKTRSQAGGRRIPSGAAVVYIVPLPDRIELLIQVGSSIYQARSPHTKKELEATAVDFRRKVTDPGCCDYKEPGGQLYEWLIKPVEKALSDHGLQQSTDTLVFVPDGLLRTIPMCALYDTTNKRHLIERYAVATIPGLDLTEGSGADAGGGQTLLLSGLSQQVSAEFNELPYVPIELKQIQNLYGNRSRELLDSSFILQNMKTEVHDRRYNVVHIASHGKFGGDANNTFILTFNGRMNLNDLERLIRPQQFDPSGQPKPVDLLVLSCCETAAGDDRAALGLGGIAVKSGARSALATLWPVSDAASTLIIPDFYESLEHMAGKTAMSKAKALQHAQRRMLSDEHVIYQHPAIWAPYMIIGNWQ
jgi:CHAT domain-containing protein